MPVKVEGLQELINRLLGAQPIVRKVAGGQLHILGGKTKEFARDELADVRYTGALDNSFVVETNTTLLETQIFPTAEHSMFVRKGTRSHWAPIGPLKLWAAVKLGDADLAYPVQWSIAREGTSVFQQRKRGTKANPWPERTITRADFLSALMGTSEKIASEIATEIATR